MDLNTALRTALSGWDADEKINNETTIPMSITQQTFDYIKARPGIKIKNAVAELQTLGLKAVTTTSLISQMVRNGLLSKVDHRLTALAQQYKSPVAMRKQVRITVKGKDINPEPVKEVTQLDQIHHLLDSISAKEAYAIYLELKKMFGGN